jgi:uncharacterized protein YxjI
MSAHAGTTSEPAARRLTTGTHPTRRHAGTLEPGADRLEALGIGFLRGHDRPGGTRYQMREKLFSIGDDSWIETDGGEKAFKVNGKAMRIRKTFILESPSGEELYKIQEKKLHIRDTMEVERGDETVASIQKALITPLRDRFSIELAGGDELSAKGNIVDHEYEIERDGDKVAQVSKRWFRIRDTYGIEIAPGQDDALILATTVCIDEMSRGRD